MWPNQRSPWSQPDEYQAMQQMQRGQQLQQMAMQQPGTGWAGVAMALLGGFGGRRLENQGYDRLKQLQDDKLEQERAKREVLVAALTGGDPKKAAEAAFGIKGMEDIGLRLLTEANKPTQVPDAILSRYTPESIAEFSKTKDYAVLQPIESFSSKGVPTGYRINPETGQAERIPGLDDYFARQTARSSGSGAPSVVVNLPGGGQAISPTKPTQNAVQGDLIAAQRTLNALDEIGNNFAENYLTYGGKAKGWALGVADKLGIPLEALPGEDNAKFLGDRKAFVQQVEQAFNNYRVAITGAAASEKELQYLRQTFLNSDLSPTEFIASFKTLQGQMRRDIDQYQTILQSGIPVQEVQAAFAATPFGQSPDFGQSPASDQSKMQQQLQGDLAAVRGSAPNAETPPVPGAKKAPDGKWYVQQNGEWFEVEG